MDDQLGCARFRVGHGHGASTQRWIRVPCAGFPYWLEQHYELRVLGDVCMQRITEILVLNVIFKSSTVLSRDIPSALASAT